MKPKNGKETRLFLRAVRHLAWKCTTEGAEFALKMMADAYSLIPSSLLGMVRARIAALADYDERGGPSDRKRSKILREVVGQLDEALDGLEVWQGRPEDLPEWIREFGRAASREHLAEEYKKLQHDLGEGGSPDSG